MAKEWTTSDEIEYLKGLGGHAGKPKHARRREALLRSYRNGMQLRKRWGKIDPELIEAYLQLELGKEQRP